MPFVVHREWLRKVAPVWTAVPVFALVRWPIFLAYIAMALAGSTPAGWGYAMAVA